MDAGELRAAIEGEVDRIFKLGLPSISGKSFSANQIVLASGKASDQLGTLPSRF